MSAPHAYDAAMGFTEALNLPTHYTKAQIAADTFLRDSVQVTRSLTEVVVSLSVTAEISVPLELLDEGPVGQAVACLIAERMRVDLRELLPAVADKIEAAV